MKSKLAVAAAIAFAGAAGGAYVLWPKSPAHRVGCAVPLSSAGAAAVARAGAGIELQVVRMPDGSRNVTFADHRRHEELLHAYGPRGKLLEADLTVRRRGGGVETQVSYTHRTWMVFRNTQLRS